MIVTVRGAAVQLIQRRARCRPLARQARPHCILLAPPNRSRERLVASLRDDEPDIGRRQRIRQVHRRCGEMAAHLQHIRATAQAVGLRPRLPENPRDRCRIVDRRKHDPSKRGPWNGKPVEQQRGQFISGQVLPRSGFTDEDNAIFRMREDMLRRRDHEVMFAHVHGAVFVVFVNNGHPFPPDPSSRS